MDEIDNEKTEKQIPINPITGAPPYQGQTIWQRVHAVMRDVSTVAKERINTHFKYKFTGHEDVTNALRSAFLKHGIVRHVSTAAVEREGSAVRIQVRVRWVNVDSPMDFIESIIPAESFGTKGPDDQQIGKAVSYAIKIAELKNFALMGDYTMDPEASKHEPGRPLQQTESANPAPPSTQEPVAGNVFASIEDRYVKLVEGKSPTSELQKIRQSVLEIMGGLSPVQRRRLGDLDKMAFHNAQKANGGN